jgi:hypothetical protein
VEWARKNLLPGTDVRSDGLACFAGVIDADCARSYIVVGSRKPRELPQFNWVNTVLANLKTLINGGYKGFKFGKYARHCLGAFAYRFNARFNLRELLHDLLGDTATVSPMPERLIRVGVRFMTSFKRISSSWSPTPVIWFDGPSGPSVTAHPTLRVPALLSILVSQASRLLPALANHAALLAQPPPTHRRISSGSNPPTHQRIEAAPDQRSHTAACRPRSGRPWRANVPACRRGWLRPSAGRRCVAEAFIGTCLPVACAT